MRQRAGPDSREPASAITSRSERIARTFVSAYLVALFAWIMLAGGTYPTLGSPLVRTMTHAMIAALVFPWLGVSLVRARWRPNRALTAAVAVIILAATITAATGLQPRMSLESVGAGALLALLFLLFTVLLSDAGYRRRLGGVLVLLPLVISAGFVVEVIWNWTAWWSLTGVPVPPLRPA